MWRSIGNLIDIVSYFVFQVICKELPIVLASSNIRLSLPNYNLCEAKLSFVFQVYLSWQQDALLLVLKLILQVWEK